MRSGLRILCFCALQVSVSYSNSLRGPPRVETRPNLSDSYVPALMQIIAHDTELMKYELKPQPQTTTVKPQPTTTKRSTPAHLPGIFQPVSPPKPPQIVPQGFPQNTKVTAPPFLPHAPDFTYFNYPVVPGIVGFIPVNGLTFNRGYGNPEQSQTILGSPNSNFGQIGQYLTPNGQYVFPSRQYFGSSGQYLGSNGQYLVPSGPVFGQITGRSLSQEVAGEKKVETRSLRKSEQEQISQIAKSLRLTEEELIDENVETYLGKGFSDVYRLANRIENDYDDEVKFVQFSKNFDDLDFGLELLKQLRKKRIPPTKAYVTLLNLYDELNKELKRLGFNKFTGYNQAVLRDLVESSGKTSALQLRFILQKALDNQDIKNPTLVNKMKTLMSDFNDENGYIHKALSDIPPLIFSN